MSDRVTDPGDKAELLAEVRDVVAALVRSNTEVATDLTKIGPAFERLYPELHARLDSLYADYVGYSWRNYVIRHTRRIVDKDESHEWRAEDKLWHRL